MTANEGYVRLARELSSEPLETAVQEGDERASAYLDTLVSKLKNPVGRVLVEEHYGLGCEARTLDEIAITLGMPERMLAAVHSITIRTLEHHASRDPYRSR